MDGPWAGYVEGVERLTRVDADIALRQLEAKVQEAIMYSFENKIVLENKVSSSAGNTTDSHFQNVTGFILFTLYRDQVCFAGFYRKPHLC